jgi:aminoglycoside phosphotransferase family enzyme
MDFDYQGRPDLSQQFMERMVAALGDRGMLRLMDFYKCYRAYVRGKVESFQQGEAEVAEPERTGEPDASRALFPAGPYGMLSADRSRWL